MTSRTAQVTHQELNDCRVDVRKARTVRSPGWIVCLECGKLLEKVSAHHLKGHGLNPAQYKEKWGYNRRSGLSSERISEIRSSAARKHGLAKSGRTSRTRNQFRTGHRGWQKAGNMRREGRLNLVDSQPHRSRPWRWKSRERNASDFGIAKARLGGATHTAIAKRIGLSSTAVYFRLRRLGFPGRPCVFEHGEPITGRTILDLLETCDVTVLHLTKLIGVSRNALYPHMRRPDKVLSPDLAHAIQQKREFLPRRAPTAKGGRPWAFTAADRRTLRERYGALHAELKLLRGWLSDLGARPSKAAVQDWVCAQARVGAIRRLLFWPEFFRWVEDTYTERGFAGAEWRPQEVAYTFLSKDYGVGYATVVRALSGD